MKPFLVMLGILFLGGLGCSFTHDFEPLFFSMLPGMFCLIWACMNVSDWADGDPPYMPPYDVEKWCKERHAVINGQLITIGVTALLGVIGLSIKINFRGADGVAGSAIVWVFAGCAFLVGTWGVWEDFYNETLTLRKKARRLEEERERQRGFSKKDLELGRQMELLRTKKSGEVTERAEFLLDKDVVEVNKITALEKTTDSDGEHRRWWREGNEWHSYVFKKDKQSHRNEAYDAIVAAKNSIYKQRKEGKNVLKEVFSDLRGYVKDNRELVYTIAFLFIIDHLIFDGAFRERFKGLVDRLLGKAEAKLAAKE